MAKKKKISKIKVKKKTWFPVLAPKVFGQRQLGESYLSTIDQAVGRVMSVNMRDLTGEVRDQHVHVAFRITNADQNRLHTKVIGYRLASAFVKRLVRKNTARLDDCFTLKSKQGETILVKSLLITQHKTQRSVNTELRKVFLHELQEELNKVDFSTFLQQLASRKLRGGLKKKLSKIYPVREATVRVLQLIEKGVKPVAVEAPVEETLPVKEAPTPTEVPT
jgi:small subunit ribosomal protein S3Ae